MIEDSRQGPDDNGHDCGHRDVAISSGEAVKNFEQGSVLISVLRVLEGSPRGQETSEEAGTARCPRHCGRALVVAEVFCLSTHSPKDQMPE